MKTLLYVNSGCCACKKDDLFPCGNYCLIYCKPGYLIEDDGYEFRIGEKEINSERI